MGEKSRGWMGGGGKREIGDWRLGFREKHFRFLNADF
jgi:hypothetical protein